MAASLNQDFVTYQGDDISPIFTVTDSTGAVVNIATVTAIAWNARRNMDTAVAVSKTKAAGQITFVTNGSDGKFQVLITAADTALLSGYYLHEAIITDSTGAVVTVSVGRMQVGLPPQWNYDPALSSTSAPTINIVRRIIGDVLPGDKQLQDDEIKYAITAYSTSVYLAAAECSRWIAAQYARKVDTVQGELHTLYSQQFKAYRVLAIELEQRGMARGGVMPYAGGISQTDKDAQVADTDRVTPQFNLMMDDNLIPISPVGNETPASPLGGNVP